MAIVENKAESTLIDKSYSSPNRTNAGEPNGSLTPEYPGEIVLDTTNNCLWKAVSSANNSWVTLTGPN